VFGVRMIKKYQLSADPDIIFDINIMEGHTMLGWVLIFLVVAIIAGILGFTGIAVAAAEIAKVIFFIFLILFIIALIAHLR
jgi:uncharacterized membrane protein YtjA (UPF0391 family)